MKLSKIIEAVQDFWEYKIKWNYEEIMYRYWRVPKYKLQLMFKYYKGDYVCWDMVNSSVDILFAQFIQFFEENEEHLQPWLEDDKWQECKHSGNWEGVSDGGSGVKYKDMLDIYVYVKYIRDANEKTCESLLHTLFSDEANKTWWEDRDEVINGEKCVSLKMQSLKNFVVEWSYTKAKLSDIDICTALNGVVKTQAQDWNPMLFADNLITDITELETANDEYRADTDALHKIEQELIELDNAYAGKIISIRQYLWW
jgi:hypothetical protein